RLIALAAVAAAVCGCAEKPSPTAPAGSFATRNTSPTWAIARTGTTGPGSEYAIYVPVQWNGDVVFYAHGIVDAAAPVTLPSSSIDELRDSLGVMGFAVAYSSYSENGWAVKD